MAAVVTLMISAPLAFLFSVGGVNPSGTTKATNAELNVPVTCGGIMVNPGDIIFGDGVVVIPQGREDEVLEKAEAKYEHEKEILQQLKAGKSTMEIYDFPR